VLHTLMDTIRSAGRSERDIADALDDLPPQEPGGPAGGPPRGPAE